MVTMSKPHGGPLSAKPLQSLPFALWLVQEPASPSTVESLCPGAHIRVQGGRQAGLG